MACQARCLLPDPVQKRFVVPCFWRLIFKLFGKTRAPWGAGLIAPPSWSSYPPQHPTWCLCFTRFLTRARWSTTVPYPVGYVVIFPPAPFQWFCPSLWVLSSLARAAQYSATALRGITANRGALSLSVLLSGLWTPRMYSLVLGPVNSRRPRLHRFSALPHQFMELCLGSLCPCCLLSTGSKLDRRSTPSWVPFSYSPLGCQLAIILQQKIFWGPGW